MGGQRRLTQALGCQLLVPGAPWDGEGALLWLWKTRVAGLGLWLLAGGYCVSGGQD